DRQSYDAAIQPFEQTGIKIRSTSSGPMGNPLIVVDGVIKDISINSISPDAIHSISVLKDESATRRYGAEGKDGVIEITTKAGYVINGDGDEIKVTGYASVPPLKQTGLKIRSTSSEPMVDPLIVVDGVIKDIS